MCRGAHKRNPSRPQGKPGLRKHPLRACSRNFVGRLGAKARRSAFMGEGGAYSCERGQSAKRGSAVPLQKEKTRKWARLRFGKSESSVWQTAFSKKKALSRGRVPPAKQGEHFAEKGNAFTCRRTKLRKCTSRKPPLRMKWARGPRQSAFPKKKTGRAFGGLWFEGVYRGRMKLVPRRGSSGAGGGRAAFSRLRISQAMESAVSRTNCRPSRSSCSSWPLWPCTASQ